MRLFDVVTDKEIVNGVEFTTTEEIVNSKWKLMNNSNLSVTDISMKLPNSIKLKSTPILELGPGESKIMEVEINTTKSSKGNIEIDGKTSDMKVL